MRKYYIITLLSALACIAQVRAQEPVTGGGIRVSDAGAYKQDDVLLVRMLLDISDLDLPSNASVQLVPVLEGDGGKAELPMIVVNGRRQHIMYQRMREKQYRRENLRINTVVRHSRRSASQIEYSYSLPYEAWMDGATLSLSEISCGCRGVKFASNDVALSQLDLVPAVYQIQPQYAYVIPETELVRYERGQAFLEFPVNRTEIRLDMGDNGTELEKIYGSIDKVRNDPFAVITGIIIHGYASPEGPYDNNVRLAEGRARAVRDYVQKLYPFPDALYTVRSTPEDWTGLEQKVEQSGMPKKGAVLEAIRSTADADSRKRAIAGIDGGAPYRYMLREFYPSLRRTEYAVQYDISSFTVEKGREIIKNRPQSLSLAEIWMVARSYEQDSEEFRDVLEIAVRLYPDDAAANLNAAGCAIADGQLDRAESYLAKAGDSAEAIHARGVLRMMQERYDEAKPLLEQAAALGVAQAGANLEQLHKAIE